VDIGGEDLYFNEDDIEKKYFFSNYSYEQWKRYGDKAVQKKTDKRGARKVILGSRNQYHDIENYFQEILRENLEDSFFPGRFGSNKRSRFEF